MIYFLLPTLFLGFIYAVLLSMYRQAWRALPVRELPDGFESNTRITVLIPARNEADNIAACLQAVLDGNYPHSSLEIIVLDDFSSDETVAFVQRISQKFQPPGSLISCICLADHLPPEAIFSPNKKKAIEIGVAYAKGEIIVTTDADCIVPKDWLRSHLLAFENASVQMVCGPVVFWREKDLFQKFQSLDFLGMMGITGAGYQLGWHRMANGANLAFRKEVFDAVNGYSGNEHLASGDDMFLVQKVAEHWPGSVVFLKSLAATVQTAPMPDLRSFWQQRLRWGTKNAALPDWPLRLSLLTVFLMCWSMWLNLGLAVAGVLSWQIIGFQWLIKCIFDFFLLSEMCRFFRRRALLGWFMPSFLLHTAYIAWLGTASIFIKNYAWKGRRTN